ncbi:hypothetical protein BDR26DRAFT_20506 [Obelidium mucronatum]|nr:hypothetical protein BDR26DRAFT_20506 [Obelidium mucronatum]
MSSNNCAVTNATSFLVSKHHTVGLPLSVASECESSSRHYFIETPQHYIVGLNNTNLMPDSSEHLHSNKYMVGNVSNSFHGETPPTISINKRKSDASEHDDVEQESRIVVKPRLNMSAHQEDSDNGESAARLSPTAPASDPKDMIATSEALILITPDDTPLKSETETASEPSQMNGPSNNTPSLSPYVFCHGRKSFISPPLCR